MMLTLSLTLAASPAYYYPDDIAAKSVAFGEASASVGPKFAEAERTVSELTTAVGRLEVGVALLSVNAPAGLREMATATRRQLTGQYLSVERHLGLIQDDFSNVFSAALERALVTVGGGKDAKVCGASGVAAMMGKSDCKGESLNAALASAIDKDAELKRNLAEILALEWPTVALPKTPVEVVAVSGVENYISLWALGERYAQQDLSDAENTLVAAIEQLEEGLASKDPKALADATAARAAYNAELGVIGGRLRTAVVQSLGKKTPANLGWCVNPATLGGCPGNDQTKAVLTLLDDRNFSL